jgi:exodeoxyribonuclease VII large subunit
MDDPRLDPVSPNPTGNVPEFTVSEISGAVKRTLEGNFGRIRVRGEVTELKRYPSGHIYFSLKDEGAKLSGIIWKSAVSRLGMQPENGVEVVATGRISSYAERSSYQMIVERMEYAGAGALLARIEALRLRLAAEGVFDAARKRVLPGLPAVIGVVTSERGAVIQDIRTTIARRFPRPILLWPVPVQGEGAAERIAAAIAGFDALPPGGRIPRPDVLIVARGGGSLEDLWSFNEEIVVRAAAASAIPLISAVGHETDTTLIDFASDRRAPTPTAAAEMAVPVRLDLVAETQGLAGRLAGAMARRLDHDRMQVQGLGRGLPDPASIINAAQQRLDDRAERLELGIKQRLRIAGEALRATAARVGLQLLRAEIARNVRRVEELAPRLEAACRRQLEQHGHRLDNVAGRLESAYQALRDPLARGFAMVRDAKGRVVTSAAAVGPDAALELEFHDGKVKTFAQGKQGRLL